MSSPDSGQHARLTIDWSTARELALQVGPTAFSLLLELTARAVTGDGPLVADGSVRHLADTTGLGKDTVGRHLRHLVSAGVVERLDPMTQFARTKYVIHLTDTGITREPATRPTRRAVPKSRPQRPASATTQPSLPFTA